MRIRQLRRLGLLAFLFLCARARVPASAQFSAPYDPDFAQPAPERQTEPAPAPEPGPGRAPEPGAPPPALEPEPAPGELPAVLLPPGGARFLLREREKADELFERPAPEPSAPERDFVDFETRLKPFEYSQDKYIRTRENLERGIIPSEGGPFEPGAIEGVVYSSATAPRPAPPEVELPTYGTSLSVTGRKVIGFQFSEKRFLNDQSKTGRPASTNLFEINQELQLRMQGKVGPKITVNVDYDDTKLNHQDISVVYTGDPNEVVQNVSFGDIDLSLPATEFVSYNKQLFGIRADIKYKGLKASFIGSRTKGTTKTRRFSGNTQFVATDILDIGYLRRQHYDVAFGVPARLPIRSGSERVFLARNTPGQTNVNDITLTVDDLRTGTPNGNSVVITSTFTQLNPGIDYTIDYVKGIISFRNQLLANQIVVLDYLDASGTALSVQTSTVTQAAGGTGRLKLIKTLGDLPVECSSCTGTEVGFNRELKTFYSIGQQQIVRDNGRGNFILKVLDQQRVEVGATLNPPQKYPDTIEVDFENGTFRLVSPFAVAGASATADPDVYAPTPISKRIIHVEYSFRFKTFFLEPNLVPQSEIILLDGIKLNRNVDYFIDYEAGFVTFFNEDRIRAQSEIDMSFEVAPFIGITNDSLLGSRVSWDFNKHASIGSTLLYQAGAKSPTVPTITELARSLLVYEFDAQLKDIRIFNKFRMTSFSGEIAQSRQNLNLNPHALIDNMEGIKQEDSASTLSQNWFIAANPSGIPTDPTRLNWLTEDVKVLEINPRAEASSNETQKTLNVSYDFSVANSTEVSIVYPFSISGNDFSQKTVLEIVMLGDNSNNQMNFTLGGIAEDADGDGVFDTEDINNDAILQATEDIGWLYNPAGKPTARFVASNGRTDTEDLNANNKLDPSDFNGDNFGYSTNTVLGPSNGLFDATTNSTRTVINFGGPTWHTFQIPLNISSATIARWTNVKQVRISLRKGGDGTPNIGTIKFARIAVVGNTWQRGQALDPSTNAPPVAREALVVIPVNSVDNPTYTPIFNAGGEATQVFNDLYGSLGALQRQSNSKNISEQALQLDFSSMTPNAVVTTRRLFSRAIDISQHKFFNFLLFKNADFPIGTNCAPADGSNGNPNCTDHQFFLRAGNDTNFFEIRVPLNAVGWQKIRIHQADTNKDSVADTWVSETPGAVVISSGSPTLQQVASLIAGVRRTGSATAGAANISRGRVFLNEIHVSEPITRVGTAMKIEANFELPGWGTFGGKYREVDRNFQTPTSVVSNQDNRSDSAYLNLTRLSFFPMTFNLQRTITDTPSAVQTGNLSNIVTLLQQGKVTTWNGSAQGNFARGAWPRMNLGHTRNRIEYQLLTRLDDRKTYNASLQYGVPINTRFLPKSVDTNYSRNLYDVSFQRADVLSLPGNFNSSELGQTFGLRLTFVPWNGSSFNPTYSVTKVREQRQEFFTGRERNLKYDKSMNQSVGFSSNYRLLSWLNPQVNYQIDTIENNILSISTFIVRGSTFVFDIGDIKTINRSGNGSISLPIQIGEIWKRTRLFKSMNIISAYQIQDGDVWNQIETGFNSQRSLWVRTPLKPSGPAAVRQSLTLRDTYNSTQRWSPLESYGLKGRWAPLRTISISNNYVQSVQRSETTGTKSKTISTTFPDLIASISQLEQMFRTQRWMSNTQMNYKYSLRKVENVGQTINLEESFGTDLRTIIRRRFDTLLSYNNRKTSNRDLRLEANTQKTVHDDATVQVTFDIRKFRFTPKTDFTHDVTKLGTGVKTQDLTVITPSLLVRADLALPRGLRLPGSSKTLLFTNRVIWTTTMSLQMRKSPITQFENSRLLTLTTSGDYEIAKNLRMTLNGAAARLWHKFLKEEDFVSYQFGTTLTFQF